MTDRTDWELLAQYIAGEATAADRVAVERWASEAAEHRALLDGLHRNWSFAASRRSTDVDAAWGRLSARMGETAPVSDDVGVLAFRRPRASALVSRLLPLAAVLVLAAGVTLFWRERASHGGGESLGTTALGARAVVSTTVGERRTIQLVDGSQIVLSATSQVRLGDGFGQGGPRDVYLEGQAFFLVRHDAAHPFVVHAAGTAAQDLGTEFDVRAYPTDSVVRVVVRDGSVSVRSDQRGADSVVVLHRNDVAMVGGPGAPSVAHLPSVERLLAWTSGEMVFEDAPMSEVGAELARWFGVDVRFADPSLRRLHLSAPFSTRQSVDDVVSVIAKTLQLRVERQGKAVVFSKTGA